MKKLFLCAVVVLASGAWAQGKTARCKKECVESTKECSEACVKAVKKVKNPDASVAGCTKQCKEAEKECNDDCDGKKPKNQ